MAYLRKNLLALRERLPASQGPSRDPGGQGESVRYLALEVIDGCRQVGWDIKELLQDLDPGSQLLGRHLQSNLGDIREGLGDAADLRVREFTLPTENHLRAGLVYLDGMIDPALVSEQVLSPLLHQELGCLEALELQNVVSLPDVTPIRTFPGVYESVLAGKAVLLLENRPTGLALEVKGYDARKIEEPKIESVVRGPREAFVESLPTNLTLIRRRIPDRRLRLETIRVGEVAPTLVAIAYLEGMAPRRLVEEVRSRLSRLEVDAVLDIGYLEELVDDNPLSPFPSTRFSERPDAVASQLLAGDVAILVDGTPDVITVPSTLNSLMQSAEDYYERYPIVSLVRVFRWVSLFITLLVPSFYVAVTTFHSELIPTSLLLRMAAGREGIPFPAFVEALIMESAFEILREAGIRMPRPLGPAITIVGVLVIGDAAVRAGVVSPIMIIVVGITAIAAFAIPNYNLANALRLWRFPMLMLAGAFGLFGLTWGFLMILSHLLSMESFGVPYLIPFSPTRRWAWRDTLYRMPWWLLGTSGPRPPGDPGKDRCGEGKT